MGTDNDKELRTSVFGLERENWKNADSALDSRAKQSKHLPDSNKEKGDTRVGRNLRSVDSRYSFRGNKLRVYPQDGEEL